MSEYSVQFEITKAVADALGGKAANAHRCRLMDFAADELKNDGADNVIPDTEDVDDNEMTTDDEELTFRFFVRHMVTTEAGADRIADKRYVRGRRLLMQDRTLGGLVRRVTYRGRKWEIEREGLQQMALVATYEVQFSTRRDDPTVAGY